MTSAPSKSRITGFKSIRKKSLSGKRTVKRLLPRLDDNFIQIYRSIVINLNFLSQLDKRTVVMADGTTYPVSRQQAPLVKQAFFKHFRG
ncbi:LytTR family DNA-binding domain-containing protein [Lacticaseibacillus rhamnosus]